MLSRQQLDQLHALPILEVPFGDKGTVGIRKMGGMERVLFLRSAVRADNTPEDEGTNLFRLLALTLCDAEGNRLYNDDEVEVMGRHDFDLLQPLIDAARKHNGMDADAVEEAKKNSEVTPS